MNIRNSSKAIIVENNRLLAIKKKDVNGCYYILPGGGQEHGENLHQTLQRECLEEIGTEIEIGELVFIREYIGKNHEHAAFDAQLHQIEYMFHCRLVNPTQDFKGGTNPDEGQISVDWIPLKDLMDCRLYPQKVRKLIIQAAEGQEAAVYLGDIN
ncbi:ADP-ribose pyrophosphatase YjhB (NUDIX family) [Scopulibacillus darangshiensis]|uniref:ADP-ribose pyrophosphatase YjhB (NUDIX family) n=1 Tax=Scopulibacillus darangshiensis TaxID=442528 RepID=A0A4V2SMV0_9BACL|nr:NUDIX domain-containing protein [Scopulibacillus darangshiensis]TCP28706.1 ADP-ribose pyrophosphatase YjhB (NUDIX family) [Scopulibacillus darangshiensis]